MSSEPNHPVHKSLNRPLTILGVERKLFFFALVIGAATFNFFSSLLGGLLMFSALFAFARWATRTDPQILRILMNASRWKVEYDPGVREIYLLERISCNGNAPDRTA